MSNPVPYSDDSSSLNSILLKREAAASAVRSGPGIKPILRPPSSSSAGSFQLVSGRKDVLDRPKAGQVVYTAADSKGESISGGGGFTGERNSDEFMSILVDSKVGSATKKPSVTTPRGLLYQLLFVSPDMIHNDEICGGPISSVKYDVFCGKLGSTCKIKSHRDKKHKMCQENTIFLLGKSTSLKPGQSSDKIINPSQYHLEIKPMHIILVKEMIIAANTNLFSIRNYDKACVMFNEFCEEYQKNINTAENAFRVPGTQSMEEFSDFEGNLKAELERQNRNDQLGNEEDESSMSSATTNDSELSDDSFLNKATKTDKTGISPIGMDEGYIVKGMKFGIEFEKDPIKQVSLLGSFLLRQEDTISNLTTTLSRLLEANLVSSDQLSDCLTPIKTDMRHTKTLADHTKISLDKHRRKFAEEKIVAKVKRGITQDIEVAFEDKFVHLREEYESLENALNSDDLSLRLGQLEQKILALESGSSSGGGIFPSTSLVTPLLPEEVRTDMANIEFKIALLESRVGAQTLRFGPITLKSLVDTELFVNDHVPSFSYGCYFDLVALLDSLWDTSTTEKSFLESEYNAQKTKFVSVDEASTSASFLHVAPLVFCGSSASSESKYGSIERSLPRVKSRDHWVSLGGMEGMKRQLEEEVLSKVGSILEEIPMTLGDSKGAKLAKEYLEASQTCFNKFVNWTETFYQELLGNSQVTEKEAWSLILHCWMAFFSDLRQIRMACANLSPGRHEVGSEGRTRIVARYVWTMGRAIVLQNEYCAKQFRNHPSISTVINYHLFQHRVPMSLYKSTMGKLESEVKTINAWKAQMGRDFKEVKKLAGERS